MVMLFFVKAVLASCPNNPLKLACSSTEYEHDSFVCHGENSLQSGYGTTTTSAADSSTNWRSFLGPTADASAGGERWQHFLYDNRAQCGTHSMQFISTSQSPHVKTANHCEDLESGGGVYDEFDGKIGYQTLSAFHNFLKYNDIYPQTALQAPSSQPIWSTQNGQNYITPATLDDNAPGTELIQALKKFLNCAGTGTTISPEDGSLAGSKSQILAQRMRTFINRLRCTAPTSIKRTKVCNTCSSRATSECTTPNTYLSGCGSGVLGTCQACNTVMCTVGANAAYTRHYNAGCGGVNSGTCTECTACTGAGNYLAGCTFGGTSGPGTCETCASRATSACPAANTYLAGCGNGNTGGSCASCTTCAAHEYRTGCASGTTSGPGTCTHCATCSNGTPSTSVTCSSSSGVVEKCSACDPGYEPSGDTCVAKTPQIYTTGSGNTKSFATNVRINVDQAANGACKFISESSPYPHLKSTCDFEEIARDGSTCVFKKKTGAMTLQHNCPFSYTAYN